jgi:hypothetical protein
MMRTVLLLAAATAGLALAAPAGADDTQGWEVTANGKNCTMLSTFEDNVSVALIWSSSTGNVTFMAAGDSLEKFAGRPGSTVALNVKFDGKVPHYDWTDNAARVIPVGTHGVGVIADWGPEYAKELTDTLAASGKATVRIGDKDIGVYDVSGGRAATDELRRCGAQLASG